MTTFVLTIEGLFLLLAILAETMDGWTTDEPGRHDSPLRVFPNCFVD